MVDIEFRNLELKPFEQHFLNWLDFWLSEERKNLPVEKIRGENGALKIYVETKKRVLRIILTPLDVRVKICTKNFWGRFKARYFPDYFGEHRYLIQAFDIEDKKYRQKITLLTLQAVEKFLKN